MSALNIPTLDTARLRLEALGMSHSSGMFDLWQHPEVQRYSGPARDAEGKNIPLPATSAADSDRLIEFWLKAAADGWGFRWAVLEAQRETFLGHIGFNSLADCSEIAYHLHPAHWGRGYMAEAARAAIDWRREGGASEIEAFIEPGNQGSIALALRLGMTATSTISEGARRYRMAL